MDAPELPRPVREALAELKEVLLGVYGQRLRGVYLYGSYARGDFQPESDVDVLVVLRDEVRPGEEIGRYSKLVSDICLRHDLVIVAIPVGERWFNQQIEPLFRNVMREGVPV